MSEQKRINKWICKKIKNEYKDKNVLITGSNSGIGFELADIFLSLGANIIMPVRSVERGTKAKNTLLEKYPQANIKLMNLDLSSFDSINSFVNQIIEEKLDIDIFVNNAGVYCIDKDTSKDGYELVMATNFLGVKLLNDKLNLYLNLLNHPVDVVITTSVAAHLAKPNYDDFFSEKHYKKMRVYGNSKLACFHYFMDYKEKNNNSNIIVYITHPGASYTPLITKAYKGLFKEIAKCFMRVFFHTPRKAALGILYAVDKKENGAYYAPRGFIHLSGYPKKCKIPRRYYKNKDKTINIANTILYNSN